MNTLKALWRIMVPLDVAHVFSEEAKEETAILISRRHCIMTGRITTQRMFEAEMQRMEQRVARSVY